MMTSVHNDQGEKVIPFLLQFHGHPSSHLWEDEEGTVHEIQQGEGGEQGDPLMFAARRAWFRRWCTALACCAGSGVHVVVARAPWRWRSALDL